MNEWIDEMNGVEMMTWVWGDRARWVVESVFLHSPDNIGVLGMSGGFTPGMSRDSGRIVPRVAIAEGNYIAGCLRLPRPASLPVLTLTLKH